MFVARKIIALTSQDILQTGSYSKKDRESLGKYEEALHYEGATSALFDLWLNHYEKESGSVGSDQEYTGVANAEYIRQVKKELDKIYSRPEFSSSLSALASATPLPPNLHRATSFSEAHVRTAPNPDFDTVSICRRHHSFSSLQMQQPQQQPQSDGDG